MDRTFLDRAYDVSSSKAASEFYDEWAASYDKDLTEVQYATPARCAAALAEFSPDKSAPILDLGCGTGLSGAALARIGFRSIDGWDPSAKMLQRAENRHVYRVLRQIDPKRPLTAPPGTYAGVTASGVLGPGLAPPEAFDQILGFLKPGGLIVFSLNDHAMADGRHAAFVDALVEAGKVSILMKEYGDHIPGIDLKAWVYVIHKG